MYFTDSEGNMLSVASKKKPKNPNKPAIITNESVQLKFTYPLSGIFHVTLEPKYRIAGKGTYGDYWSFTVTRLQIVNAIREFYKRVYTHPSWYGVWGHGIRDLAIANIRKLNQSNIYEVEIDS